MERVAAGDASGGERRLGVVEVAQTNRARAAELIARQRGRVPRDGRVGSFAVAGRG